MAYLICVHVGAGYHGRAKHASLERLMETACRIGMEATDPMRACIDAIKVLEDSPLTNSGTGSCLTIDGRVECDSSVMSGGPVHPVFGGVGCVSNIKNPIEVAHAIWKQRKNGRMSLGRVPPMILAGSAAHDWSLLHARAANPPSDPRGENLHLVTPANQAKWTKYSEAIKQEQSKQSGSVESTADANREVNLAADQLSTVGAVVVSISGDVFAGVSSGGIWMKQPGRVGHAAAFGAGCAAYNPTSTRPGVACSVSGTGEDLMERLIAFNLARAVTQQPSDSSASSVTSTKRRIDAAGDAVPTRASKRRKGDSGEVQEADDADEQSVESSTSLHSLLRSSLLGDNDSIFSSSIDGGIIAVQVAPDSCISSSSSVSASSSASRHIEFVWAHTTKHFGVGFMQRGHSPRAIISDASKDEVASLTGGLVPSFNITEQPPPSGSTTGARSCVVSGQRFRLTR